MQPALGERPRLAWYLCLASVVAALVPVIVAAARAIRRGWLPVGDNALFAIRTNDVFTIDHQPLLGTWSSASGSAQVEVNHPGPLLFELLAVPARLFEGGTGIALGVAILNSAAIIGIAVFAHRRGGPLVATVAMAVAAALGWSMGSELLFEPWGPHSVLLPFLFFLVLVWSVTTGDLVALPLALFVGSFVLQTHLSYSLLVPVLSAWAVAGLLLELGRRRRDTPDTWPGQRLRAARAGVVAAVVLVVSWLPPLIEQFTGDGKGNLSRLAEAAGDPGNATGFSLGSRLLASVVALPPWWFRNSFRNALDESASPTGWRPTSVPVAVGALVLVVGLLALGVWDARRRGDREDSQLLVTGALALVVALATSVISPIGFFGVAAHQFRFLWPVGAFVWFALLIAVVRHFAERPVPAARLVGGFAIATVVIAALNLPTNGESTSFQASSIAVVHDLSKQLGEHDIDGVVRVDGTAAFGDPYGSAVMAELQRRGIPFVVGTGLVARRHLGAGRAATGDDADAVLTVVYRDAALRERPGAERVAFHDGLSPSERRELGRLRLQIATYVREDRLRLNAHGRNALAIDALPVVEGLREGTAELNELFESRELTFLVGFDLLDLDETWAPRFDRYVELQEQSDTQTVGLFLGPAPR